MDRSDSYEQAREEWSKLQSLLKRQKFDFSYQYHLHGAALIGQIHEIAYSMLTVAKSCSHAALFPLMRTLMELSFQFLFLVKCPKMNMLRLEMNDTVERLKGLENLTSDEKSSKSDEAIECLKKRKSELKEMGASKANLSDMVNELDAKEWYKVYRMLSGYSHGQWAALAQRSLKREGGQNEIQLYRSLDDKWWEFVWSQTANLLEAVNGSIHKLNVRM